MEVTFGQPERVNEGGGVEKQKDERAPVEFLHCLGHLSQGSRGEQDDLDASLGLQRPW